jgi:uridine kinase
MEILTEQDLQDEINELTRVLDQFYDIFTDMWERVVEPYMNNSDSQILDKLTKEKFINFMFDNNTVYKQLSEHRRRLLSYT